MDDDVRRRAERAARCSTIPGLLVLAVAIGIGDQHVAALIPARNAARVDPVQALQKGSYQVLAAGENRVRAHRRRCSPPRFARRASR